MSFRTHIRVLIIAVIASVIPSLAGAQSVEANRHSKIDRALDRAVLESRDPQRVIIRTKRGGRSAIRRALELHGDLVDGNEDLRDDTLTAMVHADDVAALAASETVLSVSIDAIVTPSAALSPAERKAAAAERRAAREARRAAREARRAERRAAREARKNPSSDPTEPVPDTSDAEPTPDDATVDIESDPKVVNANAAKSSGEHLRETLGLGLTGPTGVGVVVAVIDSGIAPMEEFGGRIVASVDCTQPVCVLTNPSDEYGHGTHVAGLVAGTRAGVAPDAHLIGVKVLDANGQGFTSDVIKALAWVQANRALYGIQVANLSLGHPIYESAATDPLVLEVQRTVHDGVKVVVASGNFGMSSSTGLVGYAGVTSPGNAPGAITVGATKVVNTVTKKVTDYSSRGPTWYDGFLKPDVVAPGDSLLGPMPVNSTLRNRFAGNGNNAANDYVALSGTSMAAAVAAGAVATVLDADVSSENDWLYSLFNIAPPPSTLSSNLVKALLQYTAIPVYRDTPAGPSIYDPLTQGSGAVNAGGAIAVVNSIDTSVAAPGYWQTSWQAGDSFGQTTIGGVTYAWTQTIFWGDNIVWGSGLLTNAQSAWSDNIVWGSSYTFVDNIVWGSGWGDNIVWGSLFGGDNIVWGSNVLLDNIVWGSSFGFDNIVWGSTWGDNIVWGSTWGDNIVWGSDLLALSIDGEEIDSSDWFDNIVWGSDWFDNIVWGSDWFDNIVWGSLLDENIVWGSGAGDQQGS